MNDPREHVGRVLFLLWLRLTGVAVIGLLFAATQFVPLLNGWSFYQTPGDMAFGVALRAIFVALAGAALGSLATLLSIPFLLTGAARGQRAWTVTRIAVAIAAFGDLWIAARMVVLPVTRHIGLRAVPLFTIYCAAFALAMLIPTRRRQIVTSLDRFLGEKTTRRIALGVGASAVGIIAAEAALGWGGESKLTSPVPASAAPRPARPAGPNILFVTFDACSADDMSAYGYRLPTTPRLKEFAASATVFDNFYSASTFTTPSVATILTGLYPSEHGVYHLEGRLRGENARRTLPRLLRAAGYTTGVSTSSPYVHSLLDGIADDFDFFPEAAYRTEGYDLWRFTKPFHQRQPWGSRARDYIDLEIVRDFPADRFSRYNSWFAQKESGCAPAANFAQARSLLDRMPEGFFLWVHVYSPHGPYMPDAPWLGRFQPAGQPLTQYDREPFSLPPDYPPAYQPSVDRARLRYDEFMLQADSAFGAFINDLEHSGRLSNTAVIVAADHGESFEGGVFAHASKYQTRPELHIPLMVRLPGQQRGSHVGAAIDGTALAPSLLEIAGAGRAPWMRGQTLRPWLGDPSARPLATAPGFAFTQYLATNRIFGRIHSGSIGVIDGAHQFVLDLATGKGILRRLDEAGERDLDRSSANPELARSLRHVIDTRFPELRQHG